MLVNDGAISLVIFTLLLISYGVILHSLKNLSQEGRHKALSICGSHITVVFLFFVPFIFIYVRPPSTLPIDKYLMVFYIIITPMLNPEIHTLRNGEIKKMPWKNSGPEKEHKVAGKCVTCFQRRIALSRKALYGYLY